MLTKGGVKEEKHSLSFETFWAIERFRQCDTYVILQLIHWYIVIEWDMSYIIYAIYNMQYHICSIIYHIFNMLFSGEMEMEPSVPDKYQVSSWAADKVWSSHCDEIGRTQCNTICYKYDTIYYKYDRTWYKYYPIHYKLYDAMLRSVWSRAV